MSDGADYLVKRLGAPRAGVILGSGFRPLAAAWGAGDAVPAAAIPGYPAPRASGHDGGVAAVTLDGALVWIFLGRLHLYEGHDALAAAHPVRLLADAGARSVLLTCAAGGLLPEDRPGAFAIVTDHINLSGDDPLRRIPIGERFPAFQDLQYVYDAAAAVAWRRQAAASGLPLRDGILASLPGPCYETPAEVRMLRALGADLASMSVVCEAIYARHRGLAVAALACISNRGAGLDGAAIDHRDVVDVVGSAVVRHAEALRTGAESMLG
jgi:inosine/guanosine/xanthosine phosphorylase family protein